MRVWKISMLLPGSGAVVTTAHLSVAVLSERWQGGQQGRSHVDMVAMGKHACDVNAIVVVVSIALERQQRAHSETVSHQSPGSSNYFLITVLSIGIRIISFWNRIPISGAFQSEKGFSSCEKCDSNPAIDSNNIL